MPPSVAASDATALLAEAGLSDPAPAMEGASDPGIGTVEAVGVADPPLSGLGWILGAILQLAPAAPR
jgi:hypothetical protein